MKDSLLGGGECMSLSKISSFFPNANSHNETPSSSEDECPKKKQEDLSLSEKRDREIILLNLPLEQLA